MRNVTCRSLSGCLGIFDDDWEFVSTLLRPEGSPVASQLTEVAPLLRRLGEVLGSELGAKGG